MKLKQVTLDILDRVEKVSGVSVQLMRSDNLAVIATIKMARNGAPFHILQYKPSDKPIDYFVVQQAAYILRLYENQPDKRFDFVLGDTGVEVVKTLLLKSYGKHDVGSTEILSFSKLLAKWALMNLRSVPVGMRIDSWLRSSFEVLHELQEDGLALEQQQNLSILNLSSNGMHVPTEIMGTIAAYALFADRLLNSSNFSIPYRAAGLFDQGQRLLKVWDTIPQTSTHDCQLIDSWASTSHMNNWYQWVPFNK